MLIKDFGFSHALAKEVLKDNPNDAYALKIINSMPENSIVLDGITYDANKVDVKEVEKKHLKNFENRIKKNVRE